MKGKRHLREVVAIALSIAFLCSSATINYVEASVCPPHPAYENYEVSGQDISYVHRVETDYYVYDDNGNLISLSSITGETYYTYCTVHYQIIAVLVRCVVCKTTFNTYTYETPRIHSYCTVG